MAFTFTSGWPAALFRPGCWRRRLAHSLAPSSAPLQAALSLGRLQSATAMGKRTLRSRGQRGGCDWAAGALLEPAPGPLRPPRSPWGQSPLPFSRTPYLRGQALISPLIGLARRLEGLSWWHLGLSWWHLGRALGRAGKGVAALGLIN